MLISPPFLPGPYPQESDSDYVDRCMVGGDPGAGGYPVSYSLNWHGGLHLTDPGAETPEPVRAIADGVVAYVRQPIKADPGNKTHPLNYLGGWTDDGCVVIKHTTDIGGDATSTVTATYYSLYMHLREVTGFASGDPVYRKDTIGQAGSVYGAAGRIHFEVFCDDTNAQLLVGRIAPELDLGSGTGRSQVIFGKTYYVLPAGTSALPFDPRQIHPPPGVVTLTTERLIVSIGHAGADSTTETLREDGSSVGSRTVPGENFTSTTDCSKLFPDSPAAGLQLMRLGRVLPTETLVPPGAPYWREIVLPSGGTGFVDLNAVAVHAFSDADFPQWRGWVCVDAGSSPDSRCSEQRIRGMLDIDLDGRVTPDEAHQALSSPIVQDELSRKVCKFPSEWDDATIDQRYGWLKTDPTTRMADDKYALFRAHVAALCFWSNAGLGIDGKYWHFNPKAFIKQFRQCGWLSVDELAQCIPRRQLSLVGTAFQAFAVANWTTAHQRAGAWNNVINLMMRQYGIADTKQRVLHFLAQVFAECAFLRAVKEGGGEQATYAPYYGRGLIQLTGDRPTAGQTRAQPGKYLVYGRFRNFPATHPNGAPPFDLLGWNPDDLIARDNHTFDAFTCADSAGFYWTNSHLNALGRNGLAVSDAGIDVSDAINCSYLTNGHVAIQKVNGLDSRVGNFVYLKYVVLDYVRPAGASPTETVSFTWRDHAGQAPYTPTPYTIDVPLIPQRPPK
jgi:hypothetical protein